MMSDVSQSILETPIVGTPSIPTWIETSNLDSDVDRSDFPVLASVFHGFPPTGTRPWARIESGLSPIGYKTTAEVFYAETQPEYWTNDGVSVAATKDVAFASFEVSVKMDDLTALTERHYRVLLENLHDLGFFHVLRMWNILPKINDEQHGLERYKGFSVGRSTAMRDSGMFTGDKYPAATAIGGTHSRLIVYALAARSPGLKVENPAQIPAYRYPKEHGPRSPLFSRGMVARWDTTSTLYLSGTASIQGHSSRHSGDLIAQVQQTLRNLELVASTARESEGSDFRFDPGAAVLKVYVRDPSHAFQVRGLLQQYFGRSLQILYLNANLCRRELMVEIDGFLSVTQ
jgi:chorismate lyase/3-hydroxybenzoate synthase